MTGTTDAIRVLHVDDASDVADLTATALEREDDRIEVITALDAESALETLASRAIDCIVSDYEMPGQDGIAFLNVVRERDGDIPFILFTGKGSEVIASDAIAAGVTDYLQKRGGMDQYTLLANRIQNAVESARHRRTNGEHERRLEMLIHVLPGIVYRCRTQSPWQMENVAGDCETLTGYAAAALETDTVGWETDIVHPDDREAAVQDIEDALEAGRQFDVTYRILMMDGDTKWVRERGGRDCTGRIPGERLEGFITDITEQKKRERALRETQDRFDLVMQSAELGVWDWMVQTDEITINEQWATMLGYSLEELEPTLSTWESRVHPDDLPRVWETLNEHLAGETDYYESDQRMLTKSGDWKWIRDIGTVVERGDDGTPIRATGIHLDISERRRHEEALRELHSIATDRTRYDTETAICERTIEAAETILEFDLCVINLEEDGMLPITALSKGVPPDGATTMAVDEGIVGKTYRSDESFLFDDVQTVERANPQGPYRGAISVPIGDYGVFQVVSEEVGHFDEDDRELAELLVEHTVQAFDRLTAEAELKQQNEQLNEFASVVSHDLRNPLNVAQGRLELAAEECDSDQLPHIDRALDRMATLIDDVLTLAREGVAVTDLVTVELAATLDKSWQYVETGDATLVMEMTHAIQADEGRLQQLFENLIRNAIDHGGPDVTITAGDLDTGFYVEDDGPGIPPNQREAVFEAGYSTSTNGTGFGLRIVKQIVDAHGWAIEATDGQEGGARFEITAVEIVD
ncbi:PAS domain-containing protein [Halorarum halophilum]|uniref:histidine kinase n=1 Tax=Halorarum halophilum TaxID=2743090 RepID=A0A7D5GEH8_9EURY|nr:PAS domain-containing protein [Halobaculum halophilum]QLG27368.1 PAS domain-containing protein [Halobaculum halophilum]